MAFTSLLLMTSNLQVSLSATTSRSPVDCATSLETSAPGVKSMNARRGVEGAGIASKSASIKCMRSSTAELLVPFCRAERRADAVPGILGRVPCVVPMQLGLARPIHLPALAEGGFDLLPLGAGMHHPGLPAVFISRAIGLIRDAVRRIRAIAVVVAPPGVFDAGIDRLRRCLAAESAGHRADCRADDRAERSAHGRANCRSSSSGAGSSGADPKRVRAGRVRDRILVLWIVLPVLYALRHGVVSLNDKLGRVSSW